MSKDKEEKAFEEKVDDLKPDLLNPKKPKNFKKALREKLDELKEYKGPEKLAAALQQKNTEEVMKFIQRDYLVYRDDSYFINGIFSYYFDLDLIKFLFKFLRTIESENTRNKQELLLRFDLTKCLQSEILIFAIIFGNQETIEFILSQEVDINYQNRLGITPIFYAIRKLNEKVIKILLDKGAYLESKKNNNLIVTIMNMKDRMKKFEMIKLLLKYGYNPNIVEDSGNTVLTELFSAMTKSLTVDEAAFFSAVEMTIEQTEYVSGYGNSLSYPIIDKPERILVLLLMNGAEPNIANKISNTLILTSIHLYESAINKNYPGSTSYIELFKNYISLASLGWFKGKYNENNSENIQKPEALNNSKVFPINFSKQDYYYNILSEDTENARVTIPEGFSVQRIPKDGNCFYTSLASFLNINQGDIRNDIAQFIQNNSNDYIDSIVGNNIAQEVQTILTNGDWATNLAVFVSARLYGITVVIHYRDGGIYRIDPQFSQPSNQEVHLLYDGTHYDLLIPNIDSDSADMIITANQISNNNPVIGSTSSNEQNIIVDMIITANQTSNNNPVIERYILGEQIEQITD